MIVDTDAVMVDVLGRRERQLLEVAVAGYLAHLELVERDYPSVVVRADIEALRVLAKRFAVKRSACVWLPGGEVDPF